VYFAVGCLRGVHSVPQDAGKAFAKLLIIFELFCTKVYRKTPTKLHKLLPALATQAAHTSTVDAFNHLKHEVRFCST
jgi:hypothetical protein